MRRNTPVHTACSCTKLYEFPSAVEDKGGDAYNTKAHRAKCVRLPTGPRLGEACDHVMVRGGVASDGVLKSGDCPA